LNLTPQIYDEMEFRALQNCGQAQIVAFGSHTYEDYSFPTRVSDISQIARYIDGYVHLDYSRLEPGQFFRITPIQTDYTQDEVDLFNVVSDGVEEITRKVCGKPYGARFNLCGSFGLFRVIRAVRKLADLESLTIFEAGPGTGYTGLMAAMLGDNYASYDVTQGTYLWQSLLHDHFLEDNFKEYAFEKEYNIDRVTGSCHLPWWHFMDLRKNAPGNIDLVLSNANLGEMHRLCLKYLLRVAKLMMSSSPLGLFVFGGYGATHLGSIEEIQNEFLQAGYRKVFEDRFFGYAIDDRAFPKDTVNSLETEVPLYSPGNVSKTYGAKEFVDLTSDTFTDEYYFYNYLAD